MNLSTYLIRDSLSFKRLNRSHLHFISLRMLVKLSLKQRFIQRECSNDDCIGSEGLDLLRFALVGELPFKPRASQIITYKKLTRYSNDYCIRREGLEPPHLAAREPKSRVSTNFTTLAVA